MSLEDVLYVTASEEDEGDRMILEAMLEFIALVPKEEILGSKGWRQERIRNRTLLLLLLSVRDAGILNNLRTTSAFQRTGAGGVVSRLTHFLFLYQLL